MNARHPSFSLPILAVVTVWGLLGSVDAGDWPQWRGPAGDSVAEPGSYPIRFSSAESVVWKVKLPGLGSSTPAVWGDRIFVTCGIGGEDGVVAYDRAGAEQWQVTLGPERPGKHKNGSGANPSPITDGTRLVVYFKSGTVASLNREGKLQWKTNLQERFGADTLWWDLGSSPVLAGGKIVIPVMQEGESYVVALNPEDGSVAWKVDRTYEVQKETGQSYTTPFVTRIDGQETVVIWGADRLTGYDPADGRTRWTCAGFNPEDKPMWRVIASPGFIDGTAVVPFGRTKFLAGIRLGGSGDISSSARLWERNDLGADCPTPVGRAGRVYVLSDRGELHCLDAKTGKDLWKGSIPRASSNYYASPVLASDLLYCAREDGMVAVVRVGDRGMEVLAQNEMGERIAATPVPVQDQLFIRGAEHLFCLGNP